MDSLVSVQLRKDIHHSFLIGSSEKVSSAKCHLIWSEKKLFGRILLCSFPTVQVATLARPILTAVLESSQWMHREERIRGLTPQFLQRPHSQSRELQTETITEAERHYCLWTSIVAGFVVLCHRDKLIYYFFLRFI
ncbi:hypothetical protein AVEN_267900-1 [Araneus ventricosus]|uniref:Uncharacterized protein n=1 Tax=Araneus ventricosus TaxID=182803 RepID=A0A4Y2Q7X2_ARAVE|nr:hypothetical protein AVEN_267900-1 [Araneus ventricosus]